MADFQGWILLLLIWLISIVIVRALLTRNHKKGNQNPPSPPSLPIIGHLHLISSLPHKSFHELATRYGPIMQIYLGSVPCVVTSSPEIAKEFLKTHESKFLNRFSSTAVRYLSYGGKGIVFSPYGNYWRFMRRLCMSELLGRRTLDQFLPLRQQEIVRFIIALQKKGEAGEVVDVGGELLTLTNSIISRMTMSTRAQACSEDVDEDEDAKEIRKMVTDTAELAGKFNISDFIWIFKNMDLQRMNKRLKEILERFDSMMERVIREHEEEMKKRKEEGEGSRMRDILDILLEIHQDHSTNEIQLTRDSIKALILDIFMAGTDTSAITTEWALAELINHPHVMEKARQEIDSVTSNNSRLIQESDLANLPYLCAIVKETLRLHPAAPILIRESSESCNVCGYEIPAKSSLFVNLWSIGRDPNIWENPLEFRPERFISEENHLDFVKGHDFQLLAFGTGRRVCPGASLAFQLVPTNLGAMIQCFDLKVHGTLKMEEKPGMTVHRAHPLICVPVPRVNNPLDKLH